MENPRPEKSAVVAEVREKFEGAEAVLATEYRGLTVDDMASLRTAMAPGGGEYRVYKNTLVRIAARELGLDIEDQLSGPTALAFVTSPADGSPADISLVAKAVKDFAKSNPLLVLKGGLLGDQVLDATEALALASLPNAHEIYTRLASSIAGTSRGLAAAVAGTHRGIAYALQACIDAGAFAGGDAPESTEDAAGDSDAPETSDDAAPADAAESDTPVETDEAPTNEEAATDAASDDDAADDAAEESEG